MHTASVAYDSIPAISSPLSSIEDAFIDQKPFKYRYLVNYDLSIADLVRESGLQVLDTSICEENFQVEESGLYYMESILVHFPSTRIAEVEEELKKMGELPNVKDLLAMSAEYPRVQLETPIIALGSKWEQTGEKAGVINSPVLTGFGLKRGVGLYLANAESEHHGVRKFQVIVKKLAIKH